MIVFGTRGRRSPCSRPMRPATVVGVWLRRKQGDDAAHDLETADGQGPHGPVAQHDLSPGLLRHLSRPRAPRGPCRGLDRGGGARVGHRADRATPADRGVGARMRAGLRASNRRARHLPMRYETGLPSSVIRFRTLHASTASRRCPDELRARRQSPTIDLYRKNAFSTRAC